MSATPQAFLSYTRLDDQGHDGGITALRAALELQVRIVTGDDSFKIFQDIDGIAFGQHWPDQLDQALAASRFLIAVLSPRFFKSEPCRDELRRFLAREQTAGRDDLILPIYWVEAPVLERPHLTATDDLAAAISERQRWDWRSHAQASPTTPTVKRAIRGLARAIAGRLESVPQLKTAAVSAPIDDRKTLVASVSAKAAERVLPVTNKTGAPTDGTELIASIGAPTSGSVKAAPKADTVSRGESDSALAPDIFISYAREDEAWVAGLVAALQATGRSVFWDRRIRAGSDWRRHIGQMLEKARSILVVWSHHSIEANWVIEEASEGRERGILIPVLRSSVRPPFGFRHIHAADLSGWVARGASSEFEYFLGDVGAVLDQPVALPIPSHSIWISGKLIRDVDASWCPEMVVTPAGSFTMGSPSGEEGRGEDEGPQRTVTFAQPFALGRYTVTFAEWDACVAEGGCNGYRPDDYGWGRGRRPVIHISWEDAQTYVAWLAAQTGQPYRLPTEAQWEYAARAGTLTPFWTGATIAPDQANYDGKLTYGPGQTGRHLNQTVPVDDPAYQPNPFGLFHMHGNVFEWTLDGYRQSYRGAPSDGSIAVEHPDSPIRVARGGSFACDPRVLRSASRGHAAPRDRHYDQGFRVARLLTR